MPADRNLTLAYAGVVSLAAITLVYVFSPSFAIDSNNTSSSQRQKGVVGLVNTANDCFINSTLQALAGLPELREYLIHRSRIAEETGEFANKPFLSGALKNILDNLNEKPIRRKVISARPFLAVLEEIFSQRISRTQQDAHEFLQIVAEKLAEEYYAMEKFNKQQRHSIGREQGVVEDERRIPNGTQEKPDFGFLGEGGMPLEGTLESEIECTKCKFKTKPVQSKFVVLTLSVPQQSNATLNECIDGAFTTEYIDDFKCDSCRLKHAITYYERKLSTHKPSEQVEMQRHISQLRKALDMDPQNPPSDVPLPPSNPSTRSKIAKRTRMSDHPSVIVIHLSRSIYDQYLTSRKNVCKVSFPENLVMGGLVDRKGYKLQCVVTHKGGHDSGHYECFRRQIVWRAPFSTPHPPSMLGTPGISVTPSGAATPNMKEMNGVEGDKRCSFTESNDSVSPITTSETTLSTLLTVPGDFPGNHISSSASSVRTTTSATQTNMDGSSAPSPILKGTSPKISIDSEVCKKKKIKKNNKWWRISDDKIKEAKTNDVLAQQKEVYLLFYERVREDRRGQ